MTTLAHARASSPTRPSERVWQTVPAYINVDRTQLRSVSPYVGALHPTVEGPLEIAPGRGALVWIHALETIWVRTVNLGQLEPRQLSSNTSLKLWRLSGPLNATDTSPLMMTSVPASDLLTQHSGTWGYTQPPGTGQALLIESDTKLTVHIERLATRNDVSVWHDAAERLVSAVNDKHTQALRLPSVQGSLELEARVRLRASTAKTLLSSLPVHADQATELAAFLEAWQIYEGLAELQTLRPFIRPDFSVVAVERAMPSIGVNYILPEAATRPPRWPRPRPFRVAKAGSVITFAASGPGALRVRIRGLTATLKPEPLRVVLTSVPQRPGQHRQLALLETHVYPSKIQQPTKRPQPIPLREPVRIKLPDQRSRWLGAATHRLSVPLSPESSTYTVSIEGTDALVQISAATSIDRLDAPTRARSLRKAHRVFVRAFDKLAFAQLDPSTRGQLSELFPHGAGFAITSTPETSTPETSSLKDSHSQVTNLDLPARRRLHQQWSAFEWKQLTSPGTPIAGKAVAPLHRFINTTPPSPHNGEKRKAQISTSRSAVWEIPSYSQRTIRAHIPPALPHHEARLLLHLIGPGQVGAPIRVHLSPAVNSVSTSASKDVASTPLVWDSLLTSSIEHFELAVPPGDWSLQVDAPGGVRVFSSLPTLKDEQTEQTKDRTQSYHRIGPTREPVRFQLPSAPSTDSANPLVRLSIRSLALGDQPHAIELKTSSGKRHTLIVRAPGSDPNVLPLDPPAPNEITSSDSASQEVRITVELDTDDQWISATSGSRFLVNAAVRVLSPPGDFEEQESAAPNHILVAPETQRVLGRALLTARSRSDNDDNNDIESAELFLRRAAGWFALGQRQLAEKDLRESFAGSPHISPPLQAQRRQLVVLNQDLRASKYIYMGKLIAHAVTTPSSSPSIRTPRMLRPALATAPAASLERSQWSEQLRATAQDPRALTHCIDSVLKSPPTPFTKALGLTLALKIHSATPASSATQALTRTLLNRVVKYGPAIETDWAYALALADLSKFAFENIQSVGPFDSKLYSAFLRALTQQEHPRLRSEYNKQAKQSTWSTIGQPDSSRGSTRRLIFEPTSLRSPNVQVRHSLLAAPWPAHQSKLIRTNQRVNWVYSGKSETIQIWCDVRVQDESPINETSLRVEIEGQPAFSRKLSRQTSSISLPPTESKSTRRIRVSLEAPHDSQSACSLLPSFGLQNFKKWHVARSSQPYQATLLGPTIVRVDAHTDDLPNSNLVVDVAITRLGRTTRSPSQPKRVRLQLPIATAVGLKRGFIVIPESGPHRVTISSPSLTIPLRLATREPTLSQTTPEQTQHPQQNEQAASPPPIHQYQWKQWPSNLRPSNLRPSNLRPSNNGDNVSDTHSRDVPVTNTVGTVGARFGYGRDDLSEVDDLPIRNSLRQNISWHRELKQSRVWLRIRGHALQRTTTGSAYGTDVTVWARTHPRGLQSSLSGRVWGQPRGVYNQIAVARSVGAQVRAEFQRPFALRHGLSISPIVSFLYRYTEEPPPVYEVAPQVYNLYASNHPTALRPAVAIKWRPWQDLQLSTLTQFVPNDFLTAGSSTRNQSVDQVNQLVSLIGISGRADRFLLHYATSYQLSHRPVDEHREQAFTRHRFRAKIRASLWFGRWGRMYFDAGNSLYLSTIHPLRNIFDLGVGLFLPFGRGVRDIAPTQLPFRPLVELP